MEIIGIKNVNNTHVLVMVIVSDEDHPLQVMEYVEDRKPEIIVSYDNFFLEGEAIINGLKTDTLGVFTIFANHEECLDIINQIFLAGQGNY